MGAGFQWQGHVSIGNKGNDTMLDPTNPIPTAIDNPTVGNFDIRYLKGGYMTQMNFSYPLRLSNGKTLNLSLRVNNPINDKTMYSGAAGGADTRQPDGNLRLPNRELRQVRVPGRFSERINARLTASYTFGGATSR
jgi:opacity protein-like surface antigen